MRGLAPLAIRQNRNAMGAPPKDYEVSTRPHEDLRLKGTALLPQNIVSCLTDANTGSSRRRCDALRSQITPSL